MSEIRQDPEVRRDGRIDRLVRGAGQELGFSKAEVLEDLLREAWALMDGPARDALMGSLRARDVWMHEAHYVDHVHLRTFLINESGANRAVVCVEHPGGRDQVAEVLAIQVHVPVAAGRPPLVRGPLPEEVAMLEGMALRLSQHLVDELPHDADVPPWTSTIDWDLSRDVLTQSMEVPSIAHRIMSSRWLEASVSLNRHAPASYIDVDPVGPGDAQRFVVFELGDAKAPQAGAPAWAEVCITERVLRQLLDGTEVRFDTTTNPHWASAWGDPVVAGRPLLNPALVPVADRGPFGEPEGRKLLFIAATGPGPSDTLTGARLSPEALADAVRNPAGPEVIFFGHDGTQLDLEDPEGFARHLAWVDDYHRARGPVPVQEFSEFDEEDEPERVALGERG